MAKNMEELVNYCKQYGYIFQGSEIYGGLANSWDYGSLGVELKNNVRKKENSNKIWSLSTLKNIFIQVYLMC